MQKESFRYQKIVLWKFLGDCNGGSSVNFLSLKYPDKNRTNWISRLKNLWTAFTKDNNKPPISTFLNVVSIYVRESKR